MVLILVPTGVERDLLFDGRAPGPVELCGFGLAAAGAGAAHAIARHPDAARRGVVLVGSAGTYRPDAVPVGSVVAASEVACEGIGAGGQTAAALGFGDDTITLTTDGRPILSVASASGDTAQAADRAGRHPDAVAEEMEGFAVAVAARLFEVPLTILRGIANAAGDRDRSRWRMREALAAATAELERRAG